MPNWCENYVDLGHIDPKMMVRASLAFKEGKFLEEFIPDSANWGVKWDVGGSDGNFDLDDSLTTASLSFDSPWGPPIIGFEELVKLGFTIEAKYHECGCAFCGTWSGDNDEEENVHIEYGNWDSNTIRNRLPSELDDMFCIADDAEEKEIEAVDITTIILYCLQDAQILQLFDFESLSDLRQYVTSTDDFDDLGYEYSDDEEDVEEEVEDEGDDDNDDEEEDDNGDVDDKKEE